MLVVLAPVWRDRGWLLAADGAVPRI
jgi:hypothetical protein